MLYSNSVWLVVLEEVSHMNKGLGKQKCGEESKGKYF